MKRHIRYNERNIFSATKKMEHSEIQHVKKRKRSPFNGDVHVNILHRKFLYSMLNFEMQPNTNSRGLGKYAA